VLPASRPPHLQVLSLGVARAKHAERGARAGDGLTRVDHIDRVDDRHRERHQEDEDEPDDWDQVSVRAEARNVSRVAERLEVQRSRDSDHLSKEWGGKRRPTRTHG
jgi:hypothetical protein